MTNQPKWKCIANLGDCSPLDYGGYFVMVDKTGVYTPEAEYFEVIDCDGKLHRTAWRFCLDRCTFVNGVLSDNPYHPDKSVWFAPSKSEIEARPQDSKLLDITRYCGIEEHKLIDMLCSEDPIDRAIAYRYIGEYHGFDNLDNYPLQLTANDARKRYSRARYKVKEYTLC